MAMSWNKNAGVGEKFQFSNRQLKISKRKNMDIQNFSFAPKFCIFIPQLNAAAKLPWHKVQTVATNANKKFELMLTRRAKAYSSSGSVV